LSQVKVSRPSGSKRISVIASPMESPGAQSRSSAAGTRALGGGQWGRAGQVGGAREAEVGEDGAHDSRVLERFYRKMCSDDHDLPPTRTRP
jgi:hypothetical protein